MKEFTKCPSCVEKLVVVTLKEEGNSMVCPFCDFVY